MPPLPNVPRVTMTIPATSGQTRTVTLTLRAEGYSKDAPLHLRGGKLNEHTLKRYLYLLKKEGAIESHNGRWFWSPDGAAYRVRSRDNALPEDDYDE